MFYLQYKAAPEPHKNNMSQRMRIIQFLVLNILGKPCDVDSLQTLTKAFLNKSNAKFCLVTFFSILESNVLALEYKWKKDIHIFLFEC